MPEPTIPPFYRRQFGAKLRRLRDKAGLTLDEAARRLEKTRSALNRIETGATKADVHLVQSMMDLYDTHDPELLDEARDAMKAPWYSKFGLATEWYLDVETNAAQVRDFSPHVVPMLLQTEQYASALLARQGHSARDNQVAALKVRQQRLVDENDPLQLITVVTEPGLRRMVNAPTVMHSQLRSLVSSAQLPNVTLQVLPCASDISAPATGGFTLGTMPDTTVPALLHVDHVAGSLDIEDPRMLASAYQTFEQLRAEALNPEESITVIEALALGLVGCR
ncbi:helix-turn-helix domain-containing protein [Kibdelosporangium aridum]|uniref:helix-turn-helix domain-containing protein n=1 Tax=Kibdelosporangium aridum TaxID=2030 RepID=UPI0005264034